jgi:hypothetical protein
MATSGKMPVADETSALPGASRPVFVCPLLLLTAIPLGQAIEPTGKVLIMATSGKMPVADETSALPETVALPGRLSGDSTQNRRRGGLAAATGAPSAAGAKRRIGTGWRRADSRTRLGIGWSRGSIWGSRSAASPTTGSSSAAPQFNLLAVKDTRVGRVPNPE